MFWSYNTCWFILGNPYVLRNYCPNLGGSLDFFLVNTKVIRNYVLWHGGEFLFCYLKPADCIKALHYVLWRWTALDVDWMWTIVGTALVAFCGAFQNIFKLYRTAYWYKMFCGTHGPFWNSKVLGYILLKSEIVGFILFKHGGCEIYPRETRRLRNLSSWDRRFWDRSFWHMKVLGCWRAPLLYLVNCPCTSGLWRNIFFKIKVLPPWSDEPSSVSTTSRLLWLMDG